MRGLIRPPVNPPKKHASLEPPKDKKKKKLNHGCEIDGLGVAGRVSRWHRGAVGLSRDGQRGES